MANTNDADDLALLINTPSQVESLKHSLKQANVLASKRMKIKRSTCI